MSKLDTDDCGEHSEVFAASPDQVGLSIKFFSGRRTM
jgi:hypothetical protein